MARVLYLGAHPEPSLSLPEAPPTGPLHPWPARNATGRNICYAFPRGIERRVPALVALYLAGLRRREGPWFSIRLERGEYQALLAQVVGWRRRREPPMPGWAGHSIRYKRRARRLWEQQHARDRARGRWLKAADVIAGWAPRQAEGFLRGYRGRYEVSNANMKGLTPIVRYDGLG